MNSVDSAPSTLDSSDVVSGERPALHIVLYEPEIAANTGAVGRTCVGLGAKLWLVEPLGFQIDDRKLKRAGLDYWQYLEWEIVPDWQTLKTRIASANGVAENEQRFFYFTKRGARSYDSICFRSGDALVFGAESRGLPNSFLTDDSRTLRIPIRPQIRSLNLSVSVAVAAFEVRRQWRVQAAKP